MANLTHYNPKWGLLIGIVENLVMLVAFIAFGANISYIALFLLINLILKGIPLYTIYRTKSTVKDIYALVCIFAIYTIWVYANGGTVLEYLQKTFESILHGKNETPAMWVIAKLRTYFAQ
jgi:hypothetical protein